MPPNAEACQLLSLALYRKGALWEAVAAGRDSLELAPRNASYHANLGAVLRASGCLDEAESAYRTAIGCDPGFAAAHHNLGNLLRARCRQAEAEASYREALRLKADYPDTRRGLGSLLQSQGRLAQAIEAYRNALNEAERDPAMLSDLATCLMGLDRYRGAQDLLVEATRLDSDCAAAWGNLGALYLKEGWLFAARDATRRAGDLQPDEHRWVANGATIAKDLGDWSEAEGLFRRALAMRPDYVSAHANLLFCLNYHPDREPEQIFAEYRRFDQAHALAHGPGRMPTCAPLAGRRLKLGYVSPDFREHAARHFIEPLLAHRDRSRIEVFCYAEVAAPDAVTARFQAMSDHWRPTVGLSDAEVAGMIAADGIDVIVDLGGHTALSRLMALARKPAPVQIAYLIGHGYTSGLSAMDVFLADEVLVPHGSEHLFSERVVRLARIPLAYVPPDGLPQPSALPALARGHVTFGYFGRPERLNHKVVALWSKILMQIKGSRLMLNTRAMREDAFRDLIAGRFAEHDIGRDRLELVHTAPQSKTWAAYGEVDIALDPFPHNAGTTTIEALWLGVPVLTLKDRPSVGRMGASILTSLQLEQWIAEDEADYLARAVRFAGDLDGLKALRSSLRQRCEGSPLADGQGLARTLEERLFALAAGDPIHIFQHTPEPVESSPVLSSDSGENHQDRHPGENRYRMNMSLLARGSGQIGYPEAQHARHPGESRDPSPSQKGSRIFDVSSRDELGPGFRRDDECWCWIESKNSLPGAAEIGESDSGESRDPRPLQKEPQEVGVSSPPPQRACLTPPVRVAGRWGSKVRIAIAMPSMRSFPTVAPRFSLPMRSIDRMHISFSPPGRWPVITHPHLR